MVRRARRLGASSPMPARRSPEVAMTCSRFFLVLSCSSFLWAATAQPLVLVHHWPTDPSPCDAASTLQACIDSANSGDQVLIETNGPIAESIFFGKALTLEAQTGFAPVFSGNQTIIQASTDASAVDQTIRIEGLTLQSGQILCSHVGTGKGTLQILNNTIESAVPAGISIGADPAAGPVSFQVSGNNVSVLGDGGTGIGVGVGGSASGVVLGNTMRMGPGATYGSTGIALTNLTGDLKADVIANRITSDELVLVDIEVLRQGAGTSTVRILDNLVTKQRMQGVGEGGAIEAYASSGTISVEVANNTVDDNTVGIFAGSMGSGVTNGSVANNLITGGQYAGLWTDSLGVVTNHDNLFFGNGFDVANGVDVGSAGPGSITNKDPLYVGSGDYHLQLHSPAIDAGDDSAVPATDLDGNPITDLDGNPRIQGSHVDIGAYETAPEPNGVLGAVAGLSALTALALQRRRLVL
jgi:hypothetical protein